MSSSARLWITSIIGGVVFFGICVATSDPPEQPATATFVERNRTAEYRDAYGGELSGRAAIVVEIIDDSSYLDVTVQATDPADGVWACEQMQGLLGWDRRIEVWNGNHTVLLAVTNLDHVCQEA